MSADQKLIAPIETLHGFIRDRLPDELKSLADKVDSPDWFREAQLSPPVEGSAAAALTVAAFEALNAIYDQVAHSQIRLRGTLQDGLPVDNDASDQAVGDLDIWERTLDCSVDGQRRIYRNVWFIDNRRKRVTPMMDNALEALRDLYPGGIPSPGDLPNKRLVDAVNDWLRKRDKKPASQDSILRAAERRRR
jgi:hypothetical protein